MKTNEMREKSVDSLTQELKELRKEQFNFRMQITSGQTNNTAGLKTVRKNIARIKTLVNEKNAVNQEMRGDQ